MISYTAIDNKLWSVQKYMMKQYGCDAAGREIAPLRWWIDTGRASVPFLKALIDAKPFMIARRLHQGGSYDEAISRVKDLLQA